MGNIILGLLLLQPRSIYELRKRIDEGLNLMYSCSTGSIQAAIKKLSAKGYIRVSGEAGARGKKVYCISERGKTAFSEWVNSPMENSAKNPELAKLYFMSFADRLLRKALIERHISDLQTEYVKLDIICKQGEELSKKADSELLYYQLQSAIYGRDFIKFNISWYKNFLKSMEREND